MKAQGFKLERDFSAEDLVAMLGNSVSYVQNGTCQNFSAVTSIYEECSGIFFATSAMILQKPDLTERKNSFMLVPEKKSFPKEDSSWLVAIKGDPGLAYAKLIHQIVEKKIQCPTEIDPRAVVHPEAKIGKNTYIGPFSVVGKATIGDHCHIENNVTIRDCVTIGNHVTIQASTVIGGRGFGYVWDPETQTNLPFPHLRGVIIGDHVHIGGANNIDQGAFVDTILEEGCCTDGLVHIGHNVQLGRYTIVAAGVTFAGQVSLGAHCRVHPGAVLRAKVTVGEHTVIGIGAVVTEDLPAHSTVMGAPARSLREYKKMLDFIEKGTAWRKNGTERA